MTDTTSSGVEVKPAPKPSPKKAVRRQAKPKSADPRVEAAKLAAKAKIGKGPTGNLRDFEAFCYAVTGIAKTKERSEGILMGSLYSYYQDAKRSGVLDAILGR